jgi:hypothetical protein
MPLANRVLQVTFDMPGGPVTLDQSLNMNVKIHKGSLAVQNRCTIDVYNLSKTLREQLLSQFSQWQRQKYLQTPTNQLKWINVTVKAGWSTPTYGGSQTSQTINTATIFIGQVAFCDIISGPPNVGIKITCYTRQIDKTAQPTMLAPYSGTFAGYVAWAAGQMGFGTNFICQTSHNNDKSQNIGGVIQSLQALLISIQNAYMPNVAAFVDDGRLIVKDRSSILDPSDIITVSEFIGIPSWTEYGVTFQTLFDPTLRLAYGVTLKSILNPSLNGGTFVVMDLEYDLTTRQEAFYSTVEAAPPT